MPLFLVLNTTIPAIISKTIPTPRAIPPPNEALSNRRDGFWVVGMGVVGVCEVLLDGWMEMCGDHGLVCVVCSNVVCVDVSFSGISVEEFEVVITCDIVEVSLLGIKVVRFVAVGSVVVVSLVAFSEKNSRSLKLCEMRTFYLFKVKCI